jgi:hypothetical protein
MIRTNQEFEFMFMLGNQEGLKEKSFELVIIRTLNSFDDEKKFMIGVKKEF